MLLFSKILIIHSNTSILNSEVPQLLCFVVNKTGRFFVRRNDSSRYRSLRYDEIDLRNLYNNKINNVFRIIKLPYVMLLIE